MVKDGYAAMMAVVVLGGLLLQHVIGAARADWGAASSNQSRVAVGPFNQR